MKGRERIPVSGPRGDIQSPFAGLSIPDLPEGPTAAEKITTPKPGRVVLRKEKARRGGKVVIVISGFRPELSDQFLDHLARDAKKHCGCGGTLRSREIEIQGEETDRIRRFLETQGFRVDGV